MGISLDLQGNVCGQFRLQGAQARRPTPKLSRFWGGVWGRDWEECRSCSCSPHDLHLKIKGSMIRVDYSTKPSSLLIVKLNPEGPFCDHYGVQKEFSRCNNTDAFSKAQNVHSSDLGWHLGHLRTQFILFKNLNSKRWRNTTGRLKIFLCGSNRPLGISCKENGAHKIC